MGAMRLPLIGLFVAATIGVMPAAAQRQQAEAQCPADAAPLPAELSGWATRTPLTAAVNTGELARSTLTPGKAVDLALKPTPQVSYVLRPENPGGSVSNGGMAGFTVDRAGVYRVAIGTAAWIDVVHEGKAAMSVGHGHGPACSGIRKMVDFKLEPGSYVLEIAGNGSPVISVLVTPLP